MGRVLKKILIAILVIVGVIVVVLGALTIKNHFDSLKPHLKDDYYELAVCRITDVNNYNIIG